MKKYHRSCVQLTLAVLSIMISILAVGQAAQTPAQANVAPGVPRLVRFSGLLKDVSGNLLTNTVGITFAVYSEQTGGVPLWQETHNVQFSQGRYTVFLGESTSGGIPPELFASGQPRWLAVRVLLPGEVEQSRVLLASVPYALKAADADTLGGLPASAYLRAENGVPNHTALAPASLPSAVQTSPQTTVTTTGGTTNTVPLFTGPSSIGNSVITQSSGNISINGNLVASGISSRSVIGDHIADQWCNTPGTLDQTCIQNAINDIAVNGPLQTTNSVTRRIGKVIIPPGTYAITSSIVIPWSVTIELQGGARTGSFGTRLQGTSGVDILSIQGDSAHISNIAFYGAGSSGSAIAIGVSGGQATYDDLIEHCWFLAMPTAGIKLVNAYGLWSLANTFDSGGNFGIMAAPARITDAAAGAMVVASEFCCGAAASIYIGGGNFGDSSLARNWTITGNSFDNGGSAGAPQAIIIDGGASEITITGNHFLNSFGDDIYLLAAKNITITGNSTNRVGKDFVNSVGSSGIVVNANIGSSANYKSNGGQTAFISFVNATCANNTITNNTLNPWPGQNLATYGIFVDANCANTTVGGNNVTGATAAYSIANGAAKYLIKGQVTADTVNSVNGYQFNGAAGYSGTKSGSCMFTIQGGIITNVTGC